MYHPVGIQALSKPQVSKLLKGQPVRVKKGTHHKIHVSAEQHKKLHKAAVKGAGITLCFDPYQCDAHHHMHGEGILSKLKAVGKKVASVGKQGLAKAKEFYSAHESQLSPLKEQAKALATSKLHEYGEKLAPQIASRFGAMGSQALEAGLKMGEEHIAGSGAHLVSRGQGVRRRHAKGKGIKDIGRKIRSGIRSGVEGARSIARKAAPMLGAMAGSEFGPVGSMVGSEVARRLSTIGSGCGGGARRITHGKKVTKGGALFASGYGFDSSDEEC